MTSAEDVANNVTKITKGMDSGVMAFQFAPNANGEDNQGMFMVFNGRSGATEVTLPEGEWTIYVQGDTAGTEPLGKVSGTVTVDGISTTILVQEKAGDSTESDGTDSGKVPDNKTESDSSGNKKGNTLWLVVGFCAGLALVISAAVVVILLRRRKQQ